MYPKEDFFESHKPFVFAKPMALIVFLGITFLILPTTLEMAYLGIGEFFKMPITIKTFFASLLLLLHASLVVVFYFLSLYQVLSEFTRSSERKYLHRTRLYKLIGFFLFPLLIAYLTTLLILGHTMGWENFSSGDWFMIVGLTVIVYYTSIIFLVLRKPMLYFERKVSLLLDLAIIALGGFIYFQPFVFETNASNRFMEVSGITGIAFGLGMLIRTISGKETFAQQIIVQVYRLPDLLRTFVSSDQRRLALAIGLGQLQKLGSLEQEELIKYLVDKHEPSVKDKILNAVKFLFVTFVVALLIESPASYLFNKLVESLQGK